MPDSYGLILPIYINIPSASFKVSLQEIVESSHVVFFGKGKVIGYILHDLAHECKTTFDLWCGLKVNNA